MAEPGIDSSSAAKRRSPAALLILLVTLLLVPAAAATPVAAGEEAHPDGAEILNLHVANTPHDLLVSFDLLGAFTPEIREQLESGLPVTFNHYVEILHRRPAWFDRSVIERVISNTATYDTLTRQYRLTRRLNGEVVETTVTDRTPEMERFMTRVEQVRLCDPSDLEGDRALYLRVKSRVQKRFVFFFIPWNFETSWARVRVSVPTPPPAELPEERAP